MQQDATWRTDPQVRVELWELCGVEDELADLLQDGVDAGQVAQAGGGARGNEIAATHDQLLWRVML